MPDTPRTLTDLLTNLFQDGQVNGAISEQDFRDLIVTLGEPPRGSIHRLVAAPTIISEAGTFVKVAGTTQLNLLRGMDMPASNRLRYTGAIPSHFHLSCHLAYTMADINDVADFKFYIYDDSAGTGAVVDGSAIPQSSPVGTNVESLAMFWDVVLEQNDYIEIHAANKSDTDNLTVTEMYFRAVGAPI